MYLALLVLLSLSADAFGENPAIQFVLTNKGLQYGKHVGAGWIQDTLDRLSVPDVSGSVLGVKYTLGGVTVGKCDFPEPSVNFYKDVAGFKSSIEGLSISLTGKWSTRFGLIHDGGTFSMALFGVNLVSVDELGRDADGHLSVSSISCSAQVGDMRTTFMGGSSSWIVQKFVDLFSGRIKSGLEEKICQGVKQSVVNLEHRLQAINVSREVGPDLAVNISLTSLPLTNASSLNLGLKGEFYSSRGQEEPPFVAQPFSLPVEPRYMFSVGLSDYTLNSAAYGYYSAGLLQAVIDDSTLPPRFPVRLNTSAMGPFIPQLPKMYPDLLMDLKVYATETPTFSFKSGGVALRLLGTIKGSAVEPNSTTIPLFKLNTDANFSANAWILNGKLKGKVVMDNFTLTVAESEVGPIKMKSSEELLKWAINLDVLSHVNGQLAEGIDLPRTKHAELSNTVLHMEEGFMIISSDAKLWLDSPPFI